MKDCQWCTDGGGEGRGGGCGHTTHNWSTDRCWSVVSECDFDMQTPGSDLHHQNCHSYSGECKRLCVSLWIFNHKQFSCATPLEG